MFRTSHACDEFFRMQFVLENVVNAATNKIVFMHLVILVESLCPSEIIHIWKLSLYISRVIATKQMKPPWEIMY